MLNGSLHAEVVRVRHAERSSAAEHHKAMALATLATLDAAHDFTTLDIKINYLRPLAPGTEVRAEGRVLHGGRRIVLGEARLADPAGKLLAHGTGTCLVVARDGKAAR